MVCAARRRLGRVFAILLLVWTTVDLIDHNVCADHAGGVPGAARTAVGQAAPAQAPAIPHVDHSFCCSHTVDVQAPFHLAVTLAVVGLAPSDVTPLPFSDPRGLYHPPLA